MQPVLYAFGIETFVPMLRRLQHLLDRAAAFAAERGLDPAPWVDARLAPDMLPLSRQIQAACDHAKDTAARLMGEDPPVMENTEQTLAELRERVQKTIDYVSQATPAALDGVERGELSRPLPNNRLLKLPAIDFVRDWALPQFYFHLVTAYGILRNLGVDLGKRDFLTNIWAGVQARAP